MKTNELCEYLHVNRSTVYRMIKANQLPHFRIGSEYRFNRAAIVAWTKREN